MDASKTTPLARVGAEPVTSSSSSTITKAHVAAVKTKVEKAKQALEEYKLGYKTCNDAIKKMGRTPNHHTLPVTGAFDRNTRSLESTLHTATRRKLQVHLAGFKKQVAFALRALALLEQQHHQAQGEQLLGPSKARNWFPANGARIQKQLNAAKEAIKDADTHTTKQWEAGCKHWVAAENAAKAELDSHLSSKPTRQALQQVAGQGKKVSAAAAVPKASPSKRKRGDSANENELDVPADNDNQEPAPKRARTVGPPALKMAIPPKVPRSVMPAPKSAPKVPGLIPIVMSATDSASVSPSTPPRRKSAAAAATKKASTAANIGSGITDAAARISKKRAGETRVSKLKAKRAEEKRATELEAMGLEDAEKAQLQWKLAKDLEAEKTRKAESRSRAEGVVTIPDCKTLSKIPSIRKKQLAFLAAKRVARGN